MSRPRLAHQPALDGVRAMSVLAVLLFHGEIAGFDGGYLGVSVFFTLSGFLITTLLLGERDGTGRIDVGGFYVRRARRLLPASILCVVVVAVLAATTNVFAAVDTLRRDLLGSLLQVANWVFLAGDGSYQQLFADAAGQASPLEHYWSLAIEEQFYWLWPLAFLGLCRVAGSHRSRTIVVAAATAIFAVAAPIIAAVWGPDAAYWATPARAAEILVGAFAAFVVYGRVLSPRWSLVAAGSAVALSVAVVTFPTVGGPAYSGALPLVGAVSALLVVGLQVPGPVRTALSVAPLAWLGRISYGVYLFHWPVFVAVDAPRVDLDPLPLFVLRMAITLTLAQVSFVLFEEPIRRGAAWRPRIVAGASLASTAAAAAVVVAVVPAAAGDYWRDDLAATAEAVGIEPVDADGLAPLALVTTTTAEPSSPTTAAPIDETDPSETAVAPDPSVATSAVVSATSSPATVTAAPVPTVPPIPPLSRPTRVLVAGDSTAEATGVGLAQWALERPDLAQVTLATEPGCGFVRDGEFLVQEWTSVDPRCDRWLDQDLPARVAELRPDVVMLMTTSWDVLDRRWTDDDEVVRTPLDEPYAARMRTDLASVTQRLLDAGAGRVVWIRQPVPNVFWWSSGQAQEDPARHAVLTGAMELAAAADPARVRVVDLSAWLTASGYDTDQDARPDGVHWSPEAATRIAGDFLGAALVWAAVGS
ncbi:MAG: acyltransferase family protein [Actinomycetes bacterium]